MKPIVRYGKIATFFFASSLFFPAVSSTSEYRYLLPGNVVMTLEPAPEAIASKSLTLVATLRARLGTPKNLEIFFESTPDFKVAPERATLPQLASEPVKTHLVVLPNSSPGTNPDSESWIRMRVVYEPDYTSLAQLAEDPVKYPDPNERKRLTDRIEKNSQSHTRLTDAVRYFPQIRQAEN